MESPRSCLLGVVLIKLKWSPNGCSFSASGERQRAIDSSFLRDSLTDAEGILGGGRGAVDLGKLEHGDGRFKEFQYGNDSAVGNNKLLVNWKTTFLKREK